MSAEVHLYSRFFSKGFSLNSFLGSRLGAGTQCFLRFNLADRKDILRDCNSFIATPRCS